MTDSSRKIFYMVVAIVVSVAAWVFVVYNYKPLTEVRYSEVPISFTGEDTLSDRGLAVSEASAETVNVILSQRRIDLSKIGTDDISVSADVSRCAAGENTITLRVKGPDDTSVVDWDIETIRVSVGRTKSEGRDIDVVYADGADEDAEPITFDLSDTKAEVSCTADTLSKIDSVACVLDPEKVQDTVKSFTVELQALDAEGNALQHVVISPEEISLDASAGYLKTVKLNVPVKDDSDDDYERKYSAPSEITIKGTRDDIAEISSVTAEETDISYYTESTEIPLEFELPDGIYIADVSLGQVLKVTVTEKTEDEEDSSE